MQKHVYHKKKMYLVFVISMLVFLGLSVRLCYLMLFRASYYQKQAVQLHQREREIKAARGKIVDAKGVVLAENKSVCSVSVIHSQIHEPEKIIRFLAKELNMDTQTIRKKVETHSVREKIASNVSKEIGDRIRQMGLSGVKVDEDYKRFYPYDSLASKVLGFTGGDNQGIVGLEVAYESWLKGTNGKILTVTDARGVELSEKAESRLEAIAGNDLHISMDYNIQMYATQAAQKVMREKQAKKVSLLVMNPQNGEILAMVNVPEFSLNHPFELTKKQEKKSAKKRQELLNQKWRNDCVSDTYEPGSIFKIMTAAVCLEGGVVKTTDRFYCPGYKIVEDRRIRCHKTTGHGSETFVEGIQNSCNPVFMEVGMRLGPSKYYEGLKKIKLLEKTHVDLPGEAGTIMHQKKNIKAVELATMTFGQSFQVTPMQMVTTISSIINGGHRITPHLGVKVTDAKQKKRAIKTFEYNRGNPVISEETSKTMRQLLEGVVKDGSGVKGKVKGYRIGGKTATSQTLPRGTGKYISSYVGFAPANHPQVLAMVIIHEPKGIYYGGTIAAPVVSDLFKTILPYLGIEKNKS